MFLQAEKKILSKKPGLLKSDRKPVISNMESEMKAIQLQGNLRHKKSNEITKAGAKEVAIGAWAHSTGQPLYSTGYAGCLAVVVNDPAENNGTLAHIYDMQVLGLSNGVDNEDINRMNVRSGINHIVRVMILSTGKTVDKLECLLWAGASLNGAIGDMPDYTSDLSSMGWSRFYDETKRNLSQPGYGISMLYDPVSATCVSGSDKIEFKQSRNVWADDYVEDPEDEQLDVQEKPPVISYEHRERTAKTLLEKGREYLELTGNKIRFQQLKAILETWITGDNSVNPFMFMSVWKDEKNAQI